MKKKFLLAIIPVALSLSACSMLSKNQAIQKEPELVEDTLAHEELFGGVAESAGELMKIKAPRNAINPLTQPLVGVQYREQDDGKFALRYVAAISSKGVEAYWMRGICNPNGNQYKTFEKIDVAKVYTALSADGGVEVPSIAGEDYNFFVVYTLQNIPEENLDSYLFAYLTVKVGEEKISSLARVSRLGEGKTFTYNLETDPKYFIQGTFDGVAGIKPIDDSLTDDNYAQEVDIPLKANDSFGLFKYEKNELEEVFQCFGSNQLRNGSQYLNKSNVDSSSNYLIAPVDGLYSLYLTNTNTISLEMPAEAKGTATYYLKPGVWEADSAIFEAYFFVESTKEDKWVSMTLSSVAGYYKVIMPTDKAYDRVIFVRKDPAGTEHSWNGKWNQTGDLHLTSGNAHQIDSWDSSSFTVLFE